VDYLIRPYQKEDRVRVRYISCETAFLDFSRQNIFSDDEVLADALTLYFTDYEPQSCFVATLGNRVIGYIIGTKDSRLMSKIFNSRVAPFLIMKGIRRGVFFKKDNLKFFFYIIRSMCRGEFFAPNYSRDFPAMLHINLDSDARGKGLGSLLIKQYLSYLKANKVRGVHFGTISDRASNFFKDMGFQELFKSKRSYLKPYINREVDFYVFGMKL
jgi:GNAT superfamily N-acetyltransferase